MGAEYYYPVAVHKLLRHVAAGGTMHDKEAKTYFQLCAPFLMGNTPARAKQYVGDEIVDVYVKALQTLPVKNHGTVFTKVAINIICDTLQGHTTHETESAMTIDISQCTTEGEAALKFHQDLIACYHGTHQAYTGHPCTCQGESNVRRARHILQHQARIVVHIYRGTEISAGIK